jgi:23S rRNA (adenine2503-C2)-methyltransferase
VSTNNIFSLNKEYLLEILKGWNEPYYRVDQILNWIYKKGEWDPEKMSNLPTNLRNKLKEFFSFDLPHIVDKKDAGNTTKYLLQLSDGENIETVLIKHHNRNTICVSVQVGCSFSCKFCATGLIGLKRNLKVNEIIGQVLIVQKELWEKGKRISNVVFMGMGEPLANYEAVIRSIEILNSGWGFGIGSKHITISTVGIVPKIYDLAKENVKVKLAISLHAPDNELRNQIVPINKKYPIEELLESAWFYANITKRRITFEYVLIKDFNDKPEHANKLSLLLKGKNAHVNLIPWNKVKEYPWEPSDIYSIKKFKEILDKNGINTTLRISYGSKIRAGCGQLRASYLSMRRLNYEKNSD